MAKVTFDGPNYLIHINAGVTSIDVVLDLYSEWKRWVYSGAGAQWAAAFTTAGGEPTNPGETQFTPQYFFLQAPWAIEASNGESISIQTNLYPDDGDFDRMLITTNNTNIAIRLSDAPVVKNEFEQALEYAGKIYIDTDAPTTGDTYPYGTAAAPVTNMADAYTIGQNYGINTYYLRGAITLSGTPYTKFVIEGGAEAEIILDGTSVLTYGKISNTIISGDLGIDDIGMEYRDCHISDGLLGVSGDWFNCGFRGEFTIGKDEDILMIDCYSEIGGAGAPTLIMPVDITSENNIAFRGYMGGLLVQGFKGATVAPTMAATIALNSGKVTLDSSNVGGTISVRGFPSTAFTDNSNGTVVDTSSLTASGDALNTALEAIQYGDKVVININTGSAGTDFPIGTHGVPSNNIHDALIIAARLNIFKFHLHSNVYFTEDVENFRIEGVNGKEVVVMYGTAGEGVSVNDCYFVNCYLAGTATGGGQIRTEKVALTNNTKGLSGAFETTGIVGDITMLGNLPSVFTSCFALRLNPTDDFPHIYLGDGVEDQEVYNINLRGFNGTIHFGNSMNAGSRITLDMSAGFVGIDASNEAGTFRLTGLPENAYEDLTLPNTIVLDIDNLGPSAKVLNRVIQDIDYAGNIYVDQLNGEAGTEYPIGTFSRPVNNMADLLAIRAARGLTKVVMLNDFDVTGDSGGGFIVEGRTGGEVLTLNGWNVSGDTVVNMYVTGDAGDSNITLDKCKIFALENWHGNMYNTAILGDLTIADGENALIADSYTSSVLTGNILVGGLPISGITINIGTLASGLKNEVDLRGFYGSVFFANIDNALKRVSAHFGSGFVGLDDTCTDGILWVQGINPDGMYDNSAGTDINYGELKVVVSERSKQTVRDAMTLNTVEVPALGSIDQTIERIDDNTQE